MSKTLQLFSNETDEALLDLMKMDNEKAFKVIYKRHHGLLYVTAYKYLKDPELSKDAVQYTFLKFWEMRKQILIRIDLTNYLYTMLKNHVLNEIRNNQTALEKIYEMSQMTSDYDDRLLEELEEKEQIHHLYKAIEQLPEQKKQVCLFKLEGNLSNQEIAERMGISVPTVKTHYSVAIKLLRQHFDKLLILLISIFS
jgi:RNA polymerase sigma-70 factor (ECF subfamily)